MGVCAVAVAHSNLGFHVIMHASTPSRPQSSLEEQVRLEWAPPPGSKGGQGASAGGIGGAVLATGEGARSVFRLSVLPSGQKNVGTSIDGVRICL